MRIGVLTSTETRHRYFVSALRAETAVVAVGYESTGYTPASILPSDLSEDDAAIVTGHFAERRRQEEHYFGHNCAWVNDDAGCAVRRIAPGGLNTQETLSFLRAAAVDTVVVYGTNLIKAPLLGCVPGRMVNMHLGLSPYYRGTATNFYPLLNEEPEYVGATIHLIDAGIDSGAIFRHARPQITADDEPHTIGCKAILAGIEAMIRVLQDLNRGEATAVRQWKVPNGKLYLRRDYHPKQVVELYRKLKAGLIPRYVERAAQLAPKVRLIEPHDIADP